MSYCVNCGVKLANSEKVCPLCNTPVINPAEPDSGTSSAYPDKVDVFRPLNKKFIVGLLWLGVAAVAAIVFLCDLLTNRCVSWSAFVVGGVVYAGVLLTSVTLKSKVAGLASAFFGALALLLLIAWKSDGIEWYLRLAVPLTVLYSAYICFCLFISKAKVNAFCRVALSFLLFALVLIGTECVTDDFISGVISLLWSLYSAVPFGVAGLALLFISFNKKLLNEIKRRSFL